MRNRCLRKECRNSMQWYLSWYVVPPVYEQGYFELEFHKRCCDWTKSFWLKGSITAVSFSYFYFLYPQFNPNLWWCILGFCCNLPGRCSSINSNFILFFLVKVFCVKVDTSQINLVILIGKEISKGLNSSWCFSSVSDAPRSFPKQYMSKENLY